MFDNTSQKIKIFAYIYFFGNLVIQGYRDIYQFIELECSPKFIMSTIFDLLNGMILYFVLSLLIYGFGIIVQYFEQLNSHKS